MNVRKAFDSLEDGSVLMPYEGKGDLLVNIAAPKPPQPPPKPERPPTETHRDLGGASMALLGVVLAMAAAMLILAVVAQR